VLPRCISQQAEKRNRSAADLQKLREEVWQALSKETEIPEVLMKMFVESATVALDF
jgi:hypothetical protein